MWENLGVAIRSLLQAALVAGVFAGLIWVALQPILDAVDTLRFL
ncbi:MAG: hypothetical protein ACFCUS_11925 [Rubrimonas sp.]